jgi:hypothetical protein
VPAPRQEAFSEARRGHYRITLRRPLFIDHICDNITGKRCGFSLGKAKRRRSSKG